MPDWSSNHEIVKDMSKLCSVPYVVAPYLTFDFVSRFTILSHFHLFLPHNHIVAHRSGIAKVLSGYIGIGHLGNDYPAPIRLEYHHTQGSFRFFLPLFLCPAKDVRVI